MTSPFASNPIWDGATPLQCRICDKDERPLLPNVDVCGCCAVVIYRTIRGVLDPMLDDAEEAVARLVQMTPWREEGWVYYIRRGDLIKIGHTVNLHKRMTDLMPDAVLAVEPGPQQLESMRHVQFKASRHRNEYFRPDDDLLRHIEFVIEQFGSPAQNLPTLSCAS